MFLTNFVIGFLCVSFQANAVEDCYPVKSLKAIYGSAPELSFKVTVGVIGSGIDYNHPGLAKYLTIRNTFEEELQSLEAANNTVVDPCLFQRLQKQLGLGFPRWMDQVFQSPWPMDQVYQDGVLLAHKEHETRVASRIVEGREDVALHFVRRMYGSQQDHFDVNQVIDRFSALGVKIVNMSFGSECGVLPREELAWAQIFKKYPQMIFVVSAGNAGRNLDSYDYCPARFSRENPNVISVTSATSDGALSVNYDPDLGREILMNYGISVDVAIRADSLNVLVPHQYEQAWTSHAIGWTSHAAAEVTRVLAHAMADGYEVDAQTIKQKLIETSRQSRHLREFVKSGGLVDEVNLRKNLNRCI